MLWWANSEGSQHQRPKSKSSNPTVTLSHQQEKSELGIDQNLYFPLCPDLREKVFLYFFDLSTFLSIAKRDNIPDRRDSDDGIPLLPDSPVIRASGNGCLHSSSCTG